MQYPNIKNNGQRAAAGTGAENLGGKKLTTTKSNGNAQNSTSNKMFDLKMCLLDFMGLSTNNQKPRNSKKEQSNRYTHKYNDANIIYFNENMSMTSKSNTIKFSRYPPSNFKANPLNMGLSNRNKTMREWMNGNGIQTPNGHCGSSENTGAELSSSDDPATTNKSESITTNSPVSESSMRDTETDDCLCLYSGGGLDSFCTLCTSSFSFNRCNRCEESRCGSKCNSSISKNTVKLLNSDPACSDSSGAASSECDSVQFR